VAEEVRERYLDREGYFADARSSEAPRRLQQAALDLYYLVQQLGEHKTVTKMEAFSLLKRLYDEQCVPPTEKNPKKIELQERVSSSSTSKDVPAREADTSTKPVPGSISNQPSKPPGPEPCSCAQSVHSMR